MAVIGSVVLPPTHRVRLGWWPVTLGAIQELHENEQFKGKAIGERSSPTQFVLLKMAARKLAGELELTEQLYLLLSISGISAKELLAFKVAGNVDILELKSHVSSVASQTPFKLIPVINVGEAKLPWRAKIWSPPI